jgi:hypothetical protein
MLIEMARSRYDDLHDRLDSIETTKSGTRYERLAALVQKALNQEAGVSHDLRLVGDETEVKHQIDVTVSHSGATKRVLIECKDFDESGEPVGLGIVRDFYGVVADVKPDESIVVTCNRFTPDAMKYAKGMGIKLAVLRLHTPEDDEGRITSVHVTGEVFADVDHTVTIRFVDAAGEAAFPGTTSGKETHDRRSDTYLHCPGSDRIQIIEAIDRLLKDPAFKKEEVLPGDARRKSIDLPGCSVQRGDGPLLAINGFFVHYRVVSYVTDFLVRTPIVALILRPLDSETDLFVYEDQLKRFRIDPETGEVITKA